MTPKLRLFYTSIGLYVFCKLARSINQDHLSWILPTIKHQIPSYIPPTLLLIVPIMLYILQKYQPISSKSQINLLKITASLCIGYQGIKLLLDPAWQNAHIWNTVTTINYTGHSFMMSLAKNPAILLFVTSIIPIIFISAVALLRSHRYKKTHVIVIGISQGIIYLFLSIFHDNTLINTQALLWLFYGLLYLPDTSFIALKNNLLTQATPTKNTPSPSPILSVGIGLCILALIAIPARVYLIKGNILWSNRGEVFSWRMKLTHTKHKVRFIVKDKKTQKTWIIHPQKYASKKAYAHLYTPYAIRKQALFLKQHFQKKSIDVEVYVNALKSVNNRPYQVFIDPKTDLTTVSYHYIKKIPWIKGPIHEN